MSYAREHFVASLTITDEPAYMKKQQREMIERLMANYEGPIKRIEPTASDMLEAWKQVTPYSRMKQWQTKQRELKKEETNR